jgi:hypothetical protein
MKADVYLDFVVTAHFGHVLNSFCTSINSLVLARFWNGEGVVVVVRKQTTVYHAIAQILDFWGKGDRERGNGTNL